MRTSAIISVLGGVVLTAVSLVVPDPAAGQAFSGTSSLIRIPVATVQADGTVVGGGSFMGRAHAQYGGGQHDLLMYHAAITYLPFAEVGLRFSKLLDAGPQALGDRSVIARVQILSERKTWPALLVGAHDFISSTGGADSHFASLYLVGSKHVDLPLAAAPVGLHVGFGTDILDAVYYDYIGLFGGLEWPLFSSTDLLVEYDGDTVNIGQRTRLFGIVDVLTAAQGLDTWLAGAAVRVQL